MESLQDTQRKCAWGGRSQCRPKLPLIEDFTPDDSGISPLARHEQWYHAPCPVCGKQGRRETDVSDTFLDSAWYHLRYPSTEFDDRYPKVQMTNSAKLASTEEYLERGVRLPSGRS